MSSDYAGAMARIKELLIEQFPERAITRTYKTIQDRSEKELKSGVYTLLSRGIEGYNYEASDHAGGIDAPSQTELGSFEFVITGQMKLKEKCNGEDVDAAEFAMIKDLETFADQGIDDDELKDLLLVRSVMSQQMESPYAWVYTEWRLRLFD